MNREKKNVFCLGALDLFLETRAKNMYAQLGLRLAPHWESPSYSFIFNELINCSLKTPCSFLASAFSFIFVPFFALCFISSFLCSFQGMTNWKKRNSKYVKMRHGKI